MGKILCKSRVPHVSFSDTALRPSDWMLENLHTSAILFAVILWRACAEHEQFFP